MPDTPTIQPQTSPVEKPVEELVEEEERCIPCEVYSRIVGYLRPVQNWNEGKRQEFEERRTFTIPQSD